MIGQSIERAVQQSNSTPNRAVAPLNAATPAPHQSRPCAHLKQECSPAPRTAATDAHITNEELDELFHAMAKLKTITETPVFDRITLQLIGKKLLIRDGNMVRLTSHGKERIRLAITGDLAS